MLNIHNITFISVIILLYISKFLNYGKYYLNHLYICFIIFYIVFYIQKFFNISNTGLFITSLVSSIVYFISYEYSITDHDHEYEMIFWDKKTNMAQKPIVLFTEWLQRKYINSDGVESIYIKYEYIIIPSVITILLFLYHINYNQDTTSIMLILIFSYFIYRYNYFRYDNYYIQTLFDGLLVFYIIYTIELILRQKNIDITYYTPFCVAFTFYLSRKIAGRRQLDMWDMPGLLWPTISITIYYVYLTYRKMQFNIN